MRSLHVLSRHIESQNRSTISKPPELPSPSTHREPVKECSLLFLQSIPKRGSPLLKKNVFPLCQINRESGREMKRRIFQGKGASCGNLWSSSVPLSSSPPLSFGRNFLLCFYSSHFYCQNDENQPWMRVC